MAILLNSDLRSSTRESNIINLRPSFTLASRTFSTVELDGTRLDRVKRTALHYCHSVNRKRLDKD